MARTVKFLDHPAQMGTNTADLVPIFGYEFAENRRDGGI
jgi:hypothetical protein